MFRMRKKSHLHLQCAAHFVSSGMYYGLLVWTILQNIPLQIILGICIYNTKNSAGNHCNWGLRMAQEKKFSSRKYCAVVVFS